MSQHMGSESPVIPFPRASPALRVDVLLFPAFVLPKAVVDAPLPEPSAVIVRIEERSVFVADYRRVAGLPYGDGLKAGFLLVFPPFKRFGHLTAEMDRSISTHCNALAG